MNRRSFLKRGLTTGATLGSAAAVVTGPSARGSANNKVTVAMMGVRGHGRKLTQYFAEMPDVNMPYICDVDQNVVEPAMKIAEELQGRRPKLIEDIRTVLDDPSVDAIINATPLHWHAPGTIWACQAGKDVYVEKPISHNVREGRLMVEAARKYDRVVQVGTQARSRPNTREFVEMAQSGIIGDILMVKVWNTQMRRNIGHKEDEPVPAGINYDLWTGPIPMLPFNRNHYNGTVHWHWHYGAGDLGNDGVHWMDQARWVLNEGLPNEVSGMGRKLYFDDDQQTPDTQNITYNYKDKVLQYEMRLWNTYKMNDGQNGMEVYGTEGTLIATSDQMVEMVDPVLRGANEGDSSLQLLSPPDSLRWVPTEVPEGVAVNMAQMFRRFSTTILEGGEAHPDFGEAARRHHTLDALEHSAKTSEWVKVPV